MPARKSNLLFRVLTSTVFIFSSFTALANPSSQQSFDVMQWSGMNLGLQAGSIWNQSDWKFTNENYFNAGGAVPEGSGFDSSDTGFTGGGFIAYNLNSKPVIFGVEASFLGSSLNTSFTSPFYPETDEYHVRMNEFATVKMRVAYPLERWFFYFNSGWAGGNIKLEFEDTSTDTKGSTTEWVGGWTIGFGVDYKLASRIGLGVAYDYIGLDMTRTEASCSLCGSGPGLGSPEVEGNTHTQMLTARLTYFLGP